MNRREFITKSSMAAAFAGISGSVSASVFMPVSGKVKVLVLRGVSYADAFKAFNQMDLTKCPEFYIQKALSTSTTYTHHDGLNELCQMGPSHLVQTQHLDRYSIPDVMTDVFEGKHGKNILYFHHTEIGHSSYKLYQENLQLFFTELLRHFQASKHKVIITTDIGRNDTNNSCGGRDHSKPSALNTFAIYLGKGASRLSAHATETVPHAQLLAVKF